MVACPSDEELIALLECPDEAAHAEIAGHVGVCPACIRRMERIVSVVLLPTPSKEEGAAARSAAISFVRREQWLRKVDGLLDVMKDSGRKTLPLVGHARLAAAVASAPRSKVQLCYAADCDPSHRDYWQVSITLPVHLAAEGKLAVRLSGTENRPLVGGVFRLGEAEVRNDVGLAELSLDALRNNLRRSDVSYTFPDRRQIRGHICL